MKTFREACGDDIGLKLDLNYNFKTDGFIAIAKALTPEALVRAPVSPAHLPRSPCARLRPRSRTRRCCGRTHARVFFFLSSPMPTSPSTLRSPPSPSAAACSSEPGLVPVPTPLRPNLPLIALKRRVKTKSGLAVGPLTRGFFIKNRLSGRARRLESTGSNLTSTAPRRSGRSGTTLRCRSPRSSR